MKWLFLDANVLFTAVHNPSGKAALLMDLGRRGHWQIITSALALEEARRNLARKYPDCVDALDAAVANVTLVGAGRGSPCPLPLPAPLPKKDQPIFLAARQSGATHLLTGDLRHVGPFMNAPERTGGIVIQTVAAFLADAVDGAG